MEAFLLLFSDNLMEALVLPPHVAYVWKVILGFGLYQPLYVWIIASLGAIIGTSLNWGLGKILLTCRQKEVIIWESDFIDKASALSEKYGAWLLLFCWVPVLGTVLTLAAGFLSVRFLPMLGLVTIGNAMYFASVVFG